MLNYPERQSFEIPDNRIEITKKYLDMASERELMKLFKPPLKSPSLLNAVRRLVEQGKSKDEIISLLEGQDDPQREVIDAFPAKFTQDNIIKCWIYLYTLKRLKQINLAKQPVDEDGNITVFHGSTEDRRTSVLNEGLAADQKDTGFSQAFRDSKQGYVFFYINRDNAVDHAHYNAQRRGSSPLLISMNVNPSLLEPDLDNRGPKDAFKMRASELRGFEFSEANIQNLTE